MYKLIGAILIFLCGTFYSAAPLIRMTERIRVLSEIMAALAEMKALLHTKAPPVPLLIKEAAGKSSMFQVVYEQMEQFGPMAFYDAWRDCVGKESYLQREEKAVLLALGDKLGRYVIEEQIEALERTISALNNGHIETRVKLQSVSRLYLGTGLSLSAMLVIILL